jgi:SAM-dependent methyltransferase
MLQSPLAARCFTKDPSDMHRTEDYTGLGALAWDIFSGTEPSRDYPFYEHTLLARPGPALDVGCGSGRLLLALLRAGLEVDGVEPSADMRAIIRQNAADLDPQPVVFDQAMESLDLPRSYRTIVVPCGSFQLVRDRESAQETLRRFHGHLDPGGLLVVTIYNLLGLVGARPKVSGEWGLRARQTLPDGTEIEKHARLDGLDLIEQTLDSTVRYRRWRGDEVIEEQWCNGDQRWYLVNEMRLMLERAGFREIRTTGGYTTAAPTVDDDVWCFHASR